jgi:hypothetical protein
MHQQVRGSVEYEPDLMLDRSSIAAAAVEITLNGGDIWDAFARTRHAICRELTRYYFCGVAGYIILMNIQRTATRPAVTSKVWRACGGSRPRQVPEFACLWRAWFAIGGPCRLELLKE